MDSEEGDAPVRAKKGVKNQKQRELTLSPTLFAEAPQSPYSTTTDDLDLIQFAKKPMNRSMKKSRF